MLIFAPFRLLARLKDWAYVLLFTIRSCQRYVVNDEVRITVIRLTDRAAALGVPRAELHAPGSGKGRTREAGAPVPGLVRLRASTSSTCGYPYHGWSRSISRALLENTAPLLWGVWQDRFMFLDPGPKDLRMTVSARSWDPRSYYEQHRDGDRCRVRDRGARHRAAPRPGWLRDRDDGPRCRRASAETHTQIKQENPSRAGARLWWTCATRSASARWPGRSP